ncbi:MAG: DNA polymerase III subunit gamma/tau [Gammaproteobacteria bacterium]|nr:DNA polymerase III subunit gamma/tau [Gammaproteobacteria bacterium]
MSASTVLARKWRPQQFSEVVGQEPVVRALSQALTSGRLHHAYLFTGTRGVGKTTLARIFAKALNCRSGMSAEPCQDDIAQAIDAGNFVDLIEIDAASRTKVEDTRELLDNVQYAPSVGRFKIYIIDEVHMLSTHSFNALLKTLEEPPEHVKFLLATTDPHKLPVTILSRCLQFHLRPMTPQALHAHLDKVLTAEGIVFESAALDLVVRMSGGSVRDALSLLDQAIMLGSGAVNYDSTRDMLGLASDEQVNALLSALAQQDQAQVLALLHDWISWGADFDRLQQQLLEKCHQLAMLQSFPAIAGEADGALRQLADQVSSEQVQLWLQVALLAQDDMRLAPTAQMGFEVMLMRLLHFVAGSASTSTQQRPVKATPVANASSASGKRLAPSRPVAQVDASIVPVASVNESPHLAALAALGIRKNSDTAEKKTLNSEQQAQAQPSVTPEPTMAMVVEVDPAAAIASVVTVQPESPASASFDALPTASASPLMAWSLDDWKDCLVKWRLKGPELELANQCIRLVSDGVHQIVLAYPETAVANVTYWGDKLLAAIRQIEPQASLVWKRQWQAQWLSPEGWVMQVKQAELDAAKAQMLQEPRLQQLGKTLGLVPQWGKLEKLTMA